LCGDAVRNAFAALAMVFQHCRFVTAKPIVLRQYGHTQPLIKNWL